MHTTIYMSVVNMIESNMEPTSSFFGLVKRFSIDLDCTKSEFQKDFQKHVAEKSFFTSLKKRPQKFHGTLERGGGDFEIRERRGIFGNKKLIPKITGKVREVNFKTKVEVEVSFDIWTFGPLLLFLGIYIFIVGSQISNFPPAMLFVFPVILLVYFFQMKYYIKKTIEMMQTELQLW